MKAIRKAVIPVAGLGTRFLPATKAIPKEMLTIVDRPTIQYIVEEAVASGIEQIILVTSAGKSAIENHFDYDFQLDTVLKDRKKEQLREALDHGAVSVLLDNFDLPQMREAVAVNAGRALLEVSGGVALDQVRDIATTGVDRISIGRLTKDVTATDYSMRVLGSA